MRWYMPPFVLPDICSRSIVSNGDCFAELCVMSSAIWGLFDIANIRDFADTGKDFISRCGDYVINIRGETRRAWRLWHFMRFLGLGVEAAGASGVSGGGGVWSVGSSSGNGCGSLAEGDGVCCGVASGCGGD